MALLQRSKNTPSRSKGATGIPQRESYGSATTTGDASMDMTERPSFTRTPRSTALVDDRKSFGSIVERVSFGIGSEKRKSISDALLGRKAVTEDEDALTPVCPTSSRDPRQPSRKTALLAAGKMAGSSTARGLQAGEDDMKYLSETTASTYITLPAEADEDSCDYPDDKLEELLPADKSKLEPLLPPLGGARPSSEANRRALGLPGGAGAMPNVRWRAEVNDPTPRADRPKQRVRRLRGMPEMGKSSTDPAGGCMFGDGERMSRRSSNGSVRSTFNESGFASPRVTGVTIRSMDGDDDEGRVSTISSFFSHEPALLRSRARDFGEESPSQNEQEPQTFSSFHDLPVDVLSERGPSQVDTLLQDAEERWSRPSFGPGGRRLRHQQAQALKKQAEKEEEAAEKKDDGSGLEDKVNKLERFLVQDKAPDGTQSEQVQETSDQARSDSKNAAAGPPAPGEPGHASSATIGRTINTLRERVQALRRASRTFVEMDRAERQQEREQQQEEGRPTTEAAQDSEGDEWSNDGLEDDSDSDWEPLRVNLRDL